MNERDLCQYRRKLLALRDRLSGEIGRTADTILSDAQAVGEHDWAVSEAVDKEILLESAEEAIQRQVRDALTRIEDRTFGVCPECGKPIKKARLGATPYADCCISCERVREGD